MLSISRTKELIEDHSLTDQEAELIRNVTRDFAELIFQKWKSERNNDGITQEHNDYEQTNQTETFDPKRT